MPFVAKNAQTGERIDITVYPDPRQVLRAAELVCQFCGQPVRIQSQYWRRGAFVRAHFYHLSECDSPYEGHPESADHLQAKSDLKAMLTEWYTQFGAPKIEFEVPIPMNWRAKGRIADVMVTWTMGWREVHEIQLAGITSQTLSERTNDYRKAGIDVVWWLGKSANTESNRRYCRDYLGGCHLVEFNDEEISAD